MSDVQPQPTPLSPLWVPESGEQVASKRGHRLRAVVWAGLALVAMAGAGTGIALAVTTPAGPTVNPTQAASMLKGILASAEQAGSFHYLSYSLSTSSNSSSISQKTVGEAAPDQGQQTITINGVTFDVVVIGSTAYLQGDADAMEATLGLPPAVADAHAGQWIALAPGDSPYQSVYAAVTTMQAIEDNITFTPRLLLGDSTVGGVAVEGLRGPMKGLQGETAKGTATLYASASGRHLPVRYQEKGKVQTGTGTESLNFTISFSSWGEAVDEDAPSGAVSYGSLGVSGSPSSPSSGSPTKPVFT